jgi:hypothetical protein
MIMTTQYKWLPEQPTDEMMIAETESSYSRWSKYDIYRSMWKSAPEVNQEPAAIVRRYRDGTVVAEIRDKNMDEGTELYTHPQPKTKPLTSDDKINLIRYLFNNGGYGDDREHGYELAIITAVEQYYGIIK